MKTTIIFYKDWLPLINSLPAELQAEFWKLWSNYSGIDYSPVIKNDHLKGVFDFIISQVKKSDNKWNEVQEKRSKAGRKSGITRRKRTKRTSVQSVEQNEQKPTDVQFDEHNVKVNDNGKVNVNEKEKLKAEITKSLSGNGRTPEEVEKVATEQVAEYEKEFHSLTTWIKTNTPRVAQMKEPFTLIQFAQLRHNIPDKQKIRDLLLSMHNWKDLTTKNVSAYLTILKWAKNANS